jgi:hypothetical protein
MPIQQITSGIISDNAVVAADIADGTLTGAKLAANTLANSVFQTGSVENYMMASGGSLGARNKIINGDMKIAQRGTITGAGVDTYGACDRFKHWCADGGESGRCTMSQSTDVPANQNFKYSEKLQVTTAQASVGSAHAFKFIQRIESTNCTDLGFGSTGKYITYSFWAKVENKPGVYCVSAWFYGASSNKTIVREVSLTTSWAKYTITIPTDSTQNVVENTSTGIEIGIGLMAGSSVRSGSTASDWVSSSLASTYTSNQVNFYDSTSNALYVTGVQLEAGAVPTPFEFRQYGTELALCQRYYTKMNLNTYTGFVGWCDSTTEFIAMASFPVTMRTEPTFTSTGFGAVLVVRKGGSPATINTTTLYQTSSGTQVCRLYAAVASGLTLGAGGAIAVQDGQTAYMAWSAEL